MKTIVQDGAPVLRKTAAPLSERLFGTAKLARMVADMARALDKEPDGVALAAPQIGLSHRLFIVRKDRTKPPSTKETGDAPPPTPEVEVYINPEIIRRSRRKQVADEGCLSVRGIYGKTKR